MEVGGGDWLSSSYWNQVQTKINRHDYVENIVIENIILQFANSNLILIKILF